jgi:hypothetical protein
LRPIRRSKEDELARLIMTEFVTLDGVMKAPGDEPIHPHAGWWATTNDEDTLDYKLNEGLEAESHLLGRDGEARRLVDASRPAVESSALHGGADWWRSLGAGSERHRSGHQTPATDETRERPEDLA